MLMKPQERDLLFGRLDERSRNTWAVIEKMEQHLDKLNDSVAKNTSFRKWVKPVVIAGVVAITLRAVGLY